MEALINTNVKLDWVIAPNRFVEAPQDIKISEDIENVYYNQVLHHEILTRQEEHALFKIRKTGVNASQEFAEERLQNTLRKNSERYRQYVEKINLGNRADTNIIRHNMRLVMKRVSHYINRYPGFHKSGLTKIDLMQKGTIGLIRAIAKFDCDRGYKFSTYATKWIDQHIALSLKKEHAYTKGIFPDKFNEGESKETLLENVQSTEITPEKYTAQRMVEESLMSSLVTLDQKERRIIILRFGKGLTLKEVGKLEGCTRENIRLIQEKAIEKLRETLLGPNSHSSNGKGWYITV